MSVNVKMTGKANALKVSLCRSLVEYFCRDQLVEKKVNLEVVFRKRGEIDALARCYNLAPYSTNQTDFRIELSTTTVMRTLINLAHELAHVHQWASGLWTANSDGEVWNGTVVAKEIGPDGSKAYWNHPWEIDAYGRQLGIVMLWIAECDIDATAWYVNPF